ncbi:hypothetical protein KY366_03470 [Candidatus Woesearchaeota archaeon]|nr:hypothetical protein [Candidatus Woesearchaeota archaeon]
MATWQKKVQSIVRWAGAGFKVPTKEKKYYIKSEKREQDWEGNKKILDYPVIPDVVWLRGKYIKYNFEIEEKTDKWLIGTIMNGIMFAYEKGSEFVLIVKSEKQAELAWNFLMLLQDKFFVNVDEYYFPKYQIYCFSDKDYIKLKNEMITEFKSYKLIH